MSLLPDIQDGKLLIDQTYNMIMDQQERKIVPPYIPSRRGPKEKKSVGRPRKYITDLEVGDIYNGHTVTSIHKCTRT